MKKITTLPVDESLMTEDKFWELIDLSKWPTIDYGKVKIFYLKMLSKEECHSFRTTLDIAYCILDEVANGKINGVSDDSYSDLLNHIIGLGKESFYEHANDFQLIQNRADKNQYEESFSYCIPYDDDYENDSIYSIINLKRTAKDAIKEIELFFKLDNKEVKWLSPINKELIDIRIVISKFLNNPSQIKKFIKRKKMILEACKKIDNFFQKNRKELPRKFTDYRDDGSNFNGMCTAVITNTVYYAENVLEFIE